MIGKQFSLFLVFHRGCTHLRRSKERRSHGRANWLIFTTVLSVSIEIAFRRGVDDEDPPWEQLRCQPPFQKENAVPAYQSGFNNIHDKYFGFLNDSHGRTIMNPTPLVTNSNNMPVAAGEASIYTGLHFTRYGPQRLHDGWLHLSMGRGLEKDFRWGLRGVAIVQEK